MSLDKLKARIFAGGKKEDLDKAIFRIHHTLMKEYGWIPLEELKKTPMTTLWNLLDCIKEERKEEAKSMKQKHGRGMWNRRHA